MSELLEEYKLCVTRVQALDKNIWQSATIFGIGSVAGIIIIFNTWRILAEHPASVIIVSFIGITLNLVWWRLAKRWWSIQQAFIRRMEIIERQINFGGNLYIAYLDKINCRREIRIRDDFSNLSDEIKQELGEINNYECHGIISVLFYLMFVNIISWLSLAIIMDYKFILNLDKSVILSIIYSVILLFWFFFEIWNRP
jgi:hypothetical protein